MSGIRIGHGYDVHRFAENRRLILCGTEIDFPLGLLGHSDADVAVHALIDALLGALALGDIGKHFPDTDNIYKGIDSTRLLEKVISLIDENGYIIGNIDITIVAEKPRLAPYITQMREKLAANCKLSVNFLSIKVTSEEKLGLSGEGIGAHCVCLLEQKA